MKYFIIILEIILLCFTCTTWTVQDIEKFQPYKRKKITMVEELATLPEIREKEEEYPDARFIWNYLKNLGYSDVVSAGILGNIMVEVGGNTLDLQPTIEADGYYGICQWNEKYYPEVVGASLEEQCDYLRDTIEPEIRVFSKDYSYKSFLAIDNVREAALAFATGYERCSKKSYTLRQDCAEVAYGYFTK